MNINTIQQNRNLRQEVAFGIKFDSSFKEALVKAANTINDDSYIKKATVENSWKKDVEYQQEINNRKANEVRCKLAEYMEQVKKALSDGNEKLTVSLGEYSNGNRSIQYKHEDYPFPLKKSGNIFSVDKNIKFPSLGSIDPAYTKPGGKLEQEFKEENLKRSAAVIKENRLREDNAHIAERNKNSAQVISETLQLLSVKL